METKDEVVQAVVVILVERFALRAEEIQLESRFGDDLDLDSIDAIDFAVHVEEEHGLVLDEDDLKELRTVGDVVDVLYRKLEVSTRGAA
ncbi:MAG: acyl carrier protein [Proteobacteria bacterium]|nr:acyl carrier protein [Pseudomonadota bacterium]MCZ6782004.1 acyl carrier protein [Pseudomonadota bacterium]